MRDLLEILAAVERLPTDASATLATVVRVEGSSYRLPGARMLINASGRRIGSVSGGCLEADVARRGRLLTTAEPVALVRYDGSDEDVAWGFGLGCNGSIEIFIERLAGPVATSLDFIRRCACERTDGSMITVFRVEGDADLLPGARIMLTAAGAESSGLVTPELFAAMQRNARDCLDDGQTSTVIYQTPGGAHIHALVESIRPPTPLVIFGAGHDAVPLARLAKELGWHVTVVDRRPGYARPDHFPLADQVVACELEALQDRITITTDTVAVVMTHHFPDDRVLIERLLASPARYIGALGPRARTERIVTESAAAGARFSPQQLDRLHAPVGLDIGAEGPDQVALAIISEILATLQNRPGAPLRDRVGPIHEPPMLRVVSTFNIGSVAEARR